MTATATDNSADGLAITERLYQAFERELPALRAEGVKGWCVYEYHGHITRTLTGVTDQQAYEYAAGLTPGEFIVQGVDVEEPDYDSIQVEQG